MKYGISIKIDVSKIDKARLFKGEKGAYLDLTTFIDTDNSNEYGDHGFIAQSTSKEEREQKVQTPILGNVKVFFTGDSPDSLPTQASQSPVDRQADKFDDFDEDIPFMRPHDEYFG